MQNKIAVAREQKIEIQKNVDAQHISARQLWTNFYWQVSLSEMESLVLQLNNLNVCWERHFSTFKEEDAAPTGQGRKKQHGLTVRRCAGSFTSTWTDGSIAMLLVCKKGVKRTALEFCNCILNSRMKAKQEDTIQSNGRDAMLTKVRMVSTEVSKSITRL